MVGRPWLLVGVSLIIGLTMATLVAPRQSVAADPTVATAERQQEIRKMSAAMRVIGRFLKNEGGTLADVARSTEVIRSVATKMTAGLFPEGTAVGVDGSGARPEIWEHWDMFRERAVDLVAATNRLSAAVTSGNPESVRASVAAVAQACSACHELFRQKKP